MSPASALLAAAAWSVCAVGFGAPPQKATPKGTAKSAPRKAKVAPAAAKPSVAAKRPKAKPANAPAKPKPAPAKPKPTPAQRRAQALKWRAKAVALEAAGKRNQAVAAMTRAVSLTPRELGLLREFADDLSRKLRVLGKIKVQRHCVTPLPWYVQKLIFLRAGTGGSSACSDR